MPHTERFDRTVLPSGLRVLSARRRGSGLVALHALVEAGAMMDGAHPGHARFVASTLDRGTRRHSASSLADRLDSLGATLSVASGTEVVGVSGRALADDVRPYLRLIGDVLTAPTFPAEEVETVRGELITALRAHAQDSRYAAERLYRRMAFPPDHPHARPPDGEEAVVGALSSADLAHFHGRHYRADRTILALVGDIEPDLMADEVQQAFAAWDQRSPVDPGTPAGSPPGAPLASGAGSPATTLGLRRDFVALPGKSQADIVLGGVGVARSDPDYYAFMLATVLLGQIGLMGRIGARVREKEGMAYYAYAEMRAGLTAGPWWAKAGVHPSNVDLAVEAILDEIQTFRREGPSADELADVRDYLTGSLAVRLESHGGLAAILVEIEQHALGLDYLDRYPGIIRAVTAEQMRAAAARFPVDRGVVAVAGPA